jgi:hypothetical protein
LYKIKRPALKELQNGTTKDARLLAGASGAPSERIPIDTNYPGFRCAHPGLSYNAASRLKAGISRAKPLASLSGIFYLGGHTLNKVTRFIEEAIPPQDQHRSFTTRSTGPQIAGVRQGGRIAPVHRPGQPRRSPPTRDFSREIGRNRWHVSVKHVRLIHREKSFDS